MGPKKAKTKVPVAPIDDRPKAIAHLVADDGGHTHPVFSFSITDRSDREPWGWHMLTPEHALLLVTFIGNMGRNTWNQIRSETQDGHFKHHYMDVEQLCTKAQERLTKMQVADMGDQMFRFRLGPTERLWGFEFQGMFYAVWWDPHHEIYPTAKP